MSIISRPYQREDDLYKMQAALAEWIALAGDCGYIHVGDIPHRLFNGLRNYDVHELLRLWEDEDGTLLGWGLCYPNYPMYEVFVHPEHRGQALEQEIFDWIEPAMRGWLVKEDKADKPIELDVFECDSRRIAFLEKRGYAHKNHLFTCTTRSLNEPIPPIQLPPGFTIRSTTGIEEAEKLVEVHSASFDSKWTMDYRQVMESPGYDAERELVVVAPDGQFTAFCIIWLDERNKVGLFEPVGTHRDFRRRGLASNLMYAGMERMKEQGMETAMVCHETENEASKTLYSGLGFRPAHKILNYVKPTA